MTKNKLTEVELNSMRKDAMFSYFKYDFSIEDNVLETSEYCVQGDKEIKDL